MERITIRLPQLQVDQLKKIVDTGEFPTVSEAVRYAVRVFLSETSDRVVSDPNTVSTFGRNDNL